MCFFNLHWLAGATNAVASEAWTNLRL